MHKTRLWTICAVAAVLLAVGGCGDSSSGGSSSKVTLTVGEPSDQSIDAGKSIKYAFTTEKVRGKHVAITMQIHYISVPEISSGDGSTVDYVADSSICSTYADTLSCTVLTQQGSTITSDLSAGETYSFKIEEIGGEDTTFVIEIVYFN